MTTEPNRTDLTESEARDIVTARGFDGYGSTRLYGVYGPGSPYSGQVAAIKSEYHIGQLAEHEGATFYAMHRPDGVPIRRA